MDQSEVIRTRSICLKRTSKGQAAQACSQLNKLNGVNNAQPISKNRLKLTYSLELLTFELIEGLLLELGFKLDRTIPATIRRYYYQYIEDNLREKLAITDEKQKLICRIDYADKKKPKQYWDQYH